MNAKLEARSDKENAKLEACSDTESLLSKNCCENEGIGFTVLGDTLILLFIGHHKIDVNPKGIVQGGKRADAAGGAGAGGRWAEGRGGDAADHELDVTPCCK